MEEKKQELKGKQITSQGIVEDVGEGLLGGLTVRIDIDPPSETFSVSDIDLEMDPQKDKALVVRLRKDERIKFTGRISFIDYILGSLQITLEDVKILDK